MTCGHPGCAMPALPGRRYCGDACMRGAAARRYRAAVKARQQTPPSSTWPGLADVAAHLADAIAQALSVAYAAGRAGSIEEGRS